MKTHQISAEHLSIERIGEIINEGYKLELGSDARQRITHCREYLDRKIAESEVPIYGVTTGFGSLCKISISEDQLSQLQINLMMSHACGIGERVSNEIVKIMLLLKIQSLSYGYSGSKLDTSGFSRRIRRPRSAGTPLSALVRTGRRRVSREVHERC